MGARAFAPVGVAVFGLSTAFGYWGFDLVQNIVESITGKTVRLHILKLEQLREGIGQRDGGSVVLTSDWPEPDLVDFICASDLPIVTFSEDLADMLDWVVSTRDFGVKDGARFSSCTVASLAPAFASERALRIRGGRESSSWRICADIIEYLFPGRGEWLASSTFDYLVERGSLNRESTADWSLYASYQTNDKLKREELEVFQEVKSAFVSYDEFLDGHPPKAIDWPLELFYRQDGRSSREPFDLTGPARVLFFGPYMFLPAGDWTVRVEFEIVDAVSGVEVMTDVYINEVVTEKTFEMPATGIFAYTLSFYVEDPRQSVQIRLFTRKSAIEGVFLPRSVRVRPAPQKIKSLAQESSPALR